MSTPGKYALPQSGKYPAIFVEFDGVVVIAVHLRLISLLEQLPSQLLLFERHLIFSYDGGSARSLASNHRDCSSVETNAAPSDLSSSSDRRPSALLKFR